jgi:hypothetical protein
MLWHLTFLMHRCHGFEALAYMFNALGKVTHDLD